MTLVGVVTVRLTCPRVLVPGPVAKVWHHRAKVEST